MTTTDTLTDRELDTWLAEHLFGWTHTENGLTPPWALKEPREPFTTFSPGVRYSSTGDGMLLVLTAMYERGWGLEIVSLDKGRYSVDFMRASNDEPDAKYTYAYGNSLPRAVAEAARAALEASRPA